MEGPLRTIERVTSLPCESAGDTLELETLHCDREIETRLAAMKGSAPRRLMDRSDP